MIGRFLYIGLLLLLSGYIVVGGISNVLIDEQLEQAKNQPQSPVRSVDDRIFGNIDEMKAYDEYRRMTKAYPFYETTGDTLMYLINLMFFGVFGAMARIILSLQLKGNTLSNKKIFYPPVLGAIIGLVIVAVSDVLPDFKYDSGSQKVYYSLSLLGGIYSAEFFAWLKFKVEQIFKKGD